MTQKCSISYYQLNTRTREQQTHLVCRTHNPNVKSKRLYVKLECFAAQYFQSIVSNTFMAPEVEIVQHLTMPHEVLHQLQVTFSISKCLHLYFSNVLSQAREHILCLQPAKFMVDELEPIFLISEIVKYITNNSNPLLDDKK